MKKLAALVAGLGLLTAATALAAYPEAKRADVTETVNGYVVHDPYRWMEEPGAAESWVEAENQATAAHLAALQAPGVEARVGEVFSIGFVGSPTRVGERLFYLKRDGAAMEQPALFVNERGKETKLVDPGELDKTAKTALDWYVPSRDGRYVAYGLSQNGDENSTLAIYDLKAKRVLADRIPNTRACSLAWAPDGASFYYTRYPEGERYDRKAYRHTLGRETTKDTLVFGAKREKSDWTSVELSDDGRTLLVIESRGHANADLYAVDTATLALTPLVTDLGATVMSAAVRKDQVWLGTSLGAPKGRVVRFALAASQPAAWTTVIPEGEWPMEEFTLVGDRLVVRTLENVSSRLGVYDLDGKRLGDIALPALGSVEFGEAKGAGKGLAFSFTSFFYPPTVFVVPDLTRSLKAERAAAVTSVVRPEDYEIRQVRYPSYDGTFVNLFVVAKKGRFGTPRQLLLYGYGGFQVNMTPYFSRRAMFWLDRGGVYAVPNLRGGSEFGESWHEGGIREKKFQVFYDFEYAMRYLIQEGYTTPDRLAIEGGSNGGLLVGAMMTRCPELFKVGFASVGLYDMLRYHRWPPAELWIPEYGSAEKAGDTGFLLGYSPYHQLVPGVHYPAFFGDTAESDARVNWVHTAKFAAALQHAQGGPAPILFQLERKAGHGQGKGKSDITREYVEKMKFLISQVGDPAAP